MASQALPCLMCFMSAPDLPLVSALVSKTPPQHTQRDAEELWKTQKRSLRQGEALGRWVDDEWGTGQKKHLRSASLPVTCTSKTHHTYRRKQIASEAGFHLSKVWNLSSTVTSCIWSSDFSRLRPECAQLNPCCRSSRYVDTLAFFWELVFHFPVKQVMLHAGLFAVH